MKKIIYKIILVTGCLYISCLSWGQLPLVQGSIVITHSPNNNSCNVAQQNDPLTNAFVVSILNASNTSGIPSNPGAAGSSIPDRYVWKNGTGTNSKPNWKGSFTDVTNNVTSNWTVQNLGRVFGVTIDNNGNIYVANSSIYQGEGNPGHSDQIRRIDGQTGAMSSIWTSPVSSNTNRGLGNLKFFSFAGNNFIAVTDWEDGKIYIIRESSTTPGTWTAAGSFDPAFLTTNDNNRILPYGVAIRQTASGLGLFYGEFNLNTPGSSRVFSVSMSYSNGSFTFPTPENIVLGNVLVSPFIVNSTPIFTPVSDISFSSDYSRMIVAQQSLDNSLFISAHRARVREYTLSGVNTWNNVGTHPSGFHSGVVGYSTVYSNPPYNTNPLTNGLFDGFNGAGGVSYWNNILFTSNTENGSNLKCDTSVLYTSDIIYIGPTIGLGTFSMIPPATEITANFNSTNPTIYGVMGLPSRNNFTGSNINLDAFNYSLKIDADDVFTNCDKYNLGDIEAYNISPGCTIPPVCACGHFDSLVVANNSGSTVYPQNWPILSFNQFSSSDVLFAYYSCNPNVEACSAVYSWQVTLNGAAVMPVVQNGTNYFALNLLNNLAPGNYSLTVSATCGTKNCDPKTIQVIINPPLSVCACVGTVTINQSAVNVVSQNNTGNANPVSTVSTSFTLTSSTPVAEVRMLVDEFRLTTATGNENCTLCKNKPQTWANINSASLTGVTNQTLANPSTLEKDVRELIFNNGSLAFNLAGNTLNLTLGIPGVTGLNCCTLKGEVCIKFIIRDVNCCEREVMKCFTFNLQ